MVDFLQNYEEVYKKWETKSKPRIGQRSGIENGQENYFQNSYRNKYHKGSSSADWYASQTAERNTVSSWQRRSRFKFTELSMPKYHGLAQFKMSPAVLPQNRQRPVMGSCCYNCFPFSLAATSKTYNSSLGVRNILLTPYENRDTLLPRSLRQAFYLLSKNSKFKYLDVSSEVLANENVKSAILKACYAGKGKTIKDSDAMSRHEAKQWRIVRRIICSMKIKVSSLFMRFAGWLLFLLLRKNFKSICVYKSQIETLADITQKEVPIIYLPVNWSFMDPILITFILHMNNLRYPLIALEEKSQEPLLFYLLRCLGAFHTNNEKFRKRKSKDVYKAVLKSYVAENLKAGHCMEFFLETCRSQSGKMNCLNFDYVSILVEALMDGYIEDVYLTPVAISYEKIADGNFISEQLGHKTGVGNLPSMLCFLWRLFHSNFGSVRVDFCQPFSLKEILSSTKYTNIISALSTLETPPNSPDTNFHHSSRSPQSPTYTLQPILRDLGRHIAYDSTAASALMCTHLVAFLFLTKQRKGATQQQLIYNFNWLRRELNRRKKDVGFTGDTCDVVKYAMNLLSKELIHKETIEMDLSSSDMENNNAKITIYQPVIKLPYVLELQYYANAVVPVFLFDSIVVNALFALLDEDIEMLQGCDSKLLVSRQDLLEKSLELIDILQFEFILSRPCQDMSQVINDVVENLISKECFEVSGCVRLLSGRVQHSYVNRSQYDFELDHSDNEDEDNRVQQLKVDLSEESISYLQFMRSILSPYIESYWLASCALLKLVHEEKEECEFLREMQKTAQDRLHRGLLAYEESFAADTLQNALKLFEHMKVIENYDCSSVKIIYLQSNYDCEDKIDEVIMRIEQFRK